MDIVRIQKSDFSIADEYEACRTRVGGSCGAIVTFSGLVRDRGDNARVDALYLEHYPGMTERSIASVLGSARERWRLLDIVVVHRVGALRAHDQIVLVITASSHRPDAFAACEYVMDALKTEAVFWKKELKSDGEEWIRSTENDYARRDRWRESVMASESD